MKLGFIGLLTFAVILVLAFIVFYFSTRYESAFEADQACHSEMSINYPENTNLGCDHDLETRQWILFEELPSLEPAKVLKRYRY